MVANGSPIAVELIDIVGVLFANELILDEELVALRLVADWLKRLRFGLGLSQGSPAGLWAAIVSATGLGTITMPVTFGGDRALFRLAELFEHFTAIRRLDVLQLLVRIAGNEAPPADVFELAHLREGARIVMAIQRRGRHASKPVTIGSA